MPATIDLTDQCFDRLKVLYRDLKPSPKPRWMCQCACGNLRSVMGESLRRGATKSCGCLRRELMTTHGGWNTPEYIVFQNMHQRCENPKAINYEYYGGRGITVAPEWEDFGIFFSAVGPRPSPQHTLERIDNDLGYWPGNVMWATKIAQSQNTRQNRNIWFRGQRRSMSEWARRMGLGVETLRNRLAQGWDTERAMLTPAREIQEGNPRCWVTYNGETKSATEWAAVVGLPAHVISDRVRHGWSHEQALTTPKKHTRMDTPR